MEKLEKLSFDVMEPHVKRRRILNDLFDKNKTEMSAPSADGAPGINDKLRRVKNTSAEKLTGIYQHPVLKI